MREFLLAVAIVCAAWATTWACGAIAQTDGLVVLLYGLAAGVLCNIVFGAGYHLALWRALGPQGLLPKGWWWSPTRYHRLLQPQQKSLVMPWFYCGAASFVGVIGAAVAMMILGYRHR